MNHIYQDKMSQPPQIQLKNNESALSLFNLENLPFYFQVEPSYVTWKLKSIILPYYTQTYIPLRSESDYDKDKDPNIPKIDYPDLFVPLLSFLMYLLLISLSRLMYKTTFDPDILLSFALKNMCVVILQSLLVKMLVLVSSKITIPFFDCISYSSNKFIFLALCAITSKFRLVFYVLIMYSVISILYISKQVFALLGLKDNSIQLKQVYLNGIIELFAISLVLVDFC